MLKLLARILMAGLIITLFGGHPAFAQNETQGNGAPEEFCREGRFISYARGGFSSPTYYVFLNAEQNKISFWEAQAGHWVIEELIPDLEPGLHKPAEGISGMVAELDTERWHREARYFKQLTASWNTQYFNPDIMDGIQWNIFVCVDNDCPQYNGSNAYPPNFEELRKHLQKLYGEFGGKETIPF